LVSKFNILLALCCFKEYGGINNCRSCDLKQPCFSSNCWR